MAEEQSTPALTSVDGQINQDALMTVPAGTVVRAVDGTIACRYDETRGVVFGDERPFPWTVLRAPAVVLWPVDRVVPLPPAVSTRFHNRDGDGICTKCGRGLTAVDIVDGEQSGCDS